MTKLLAICLFISGTANALDSSRALDKLISLGLITYDCSVEFVPWNPLPMAQMSQMNHFAIIAANPQSASQLLLNHLDVRFPAPGQIWTNRLGNGVDPYQIVDFNCVKAN